MVRVQSPGHAQGRAARGVERRGAEHDPARSLGNQLEGPRRNPRPCERVESGEDDMRFDGIHHITNITGDAPQNVDYYVNSLGLRMVKKTVNQDDPTVYHLFYADEHGSPGSDITFFEYPGAQRGRAGAGMVHRIAF